ncbi:hypothetical protein Pcinc_009030 [Petrolisthes cinctipes]|uniref:Reverse transcriptase domain-containing protein n=1 Tax=Petrolisthes cinctipes TaxID=88211 RepID=A0AAE1G5F9_PETCI|nr:hypothetical protein Pcinc_009030 [Petrolisthes cinctipes]
MVSVAQVRTVLRKGDWLASLDLKDAYWHVPIHPRFRRFLAFQVGTETFQFTRLPFGLSLAPRVFTKLVRVVASRLAEAGVPTLMYLDDWLLHAPSKEQVANNVQVARGVLEEMGFLLNIPKSSLTPTRKLYWLGIEWDSLSATLSLAPDNARRTLRHVRRAHFSRTFSRRQWESLLGSLNFAAPAMPLGRLKHRRLTREVNLHLSPAHRDLPRQVSPSLHRLLRPWLRPGALRQRVPWVFPPPGITVATDASDVGWGYQSCLGHQRCGGWKEGERLLHINARELMVAKEWLNRHPQFARIGVRFDMDNVAAVQCLQKQGTVRSEILLSLSEQIFAIAAKRDIHLSARYVPGRENDWADALSRFRGTSVEWQLRPLVFESLCLRYGTPEVDLFASPSTALLPLFLTFSSRTEAGGPDAFTEDWNRWGHLYLFPPPATSVLLKAILKLRTFRGRVLLIAPRWPAQPCVTETTRLEFLRGVLSKRFTKETVDKMLRAHRQSSVRQYESCWKRFQDFLRRHPSRVISEDTVLEFLTWLADSTNRAPATVLAHHAALSDPLLLGFNIKVSERPLSLLRMGIRAGTAPHRAQAPSWSLHRVLSYLTFEGVPLEVCHLLQKALFLLALATGYRASQLAALTRHTAFSSVTPNLTSLTISPSPAFLAKNEQADDRIGPLAVPSFLRDGNFHPLCPVHAFVAYVEATRGASPDHLFYNSRSGNPLFPRSIARLLCRVIENGDPGHAPRAHSVRGVAASLAFLRTHSVERVRDLGGWASTSSFRTRYLFHSLSPTPCVAMGTPPPIPQGPRGRHMGGRGRPKRKGRVI